MVRRRVKEGELSWQFPAGGVEEGETAEQAAVRETLEETGLTVKAVRYIGDRVHPKSGKFMAYTACEVVDGEARVADDEELDKVAWVAHSEIPDLVPYGLFGPVQEYLDAVLPH
jgi:8-oxo-dGTP diphosphatase